MRDDWQAKTKEWSVKSKYNSFNSYKGLTYHSTHYRPIAKWFKGEGRLPAPVELSLDPGHVCNFGCPHCNAQRYLVINPNEVPEDKKLMTKEHLHRLMDFMAEWGVRGVCLGGGGEPLMNRNVWDLPSYIKSKGMKSSFATNGSLINEDIAREMMNCRWVGVSVDAGTRDVFHKVHGVDQFDRVIENLKLLVRLKKETGSKMDIAYKFLINPTNFHDIYNACKLAKEIGVRDFHARPVDLERKDFEAAMQLNYDFDEIHDLFAKCHELQEGDDFRVFTVMHKYNPKFRVMHTFKNCVGSSIMIQCCADGNVYVCADHRLEDRFKLCSHHPDPKNILDFWGSDKHRDILKSINVDGECARCFVPGTKVNTPEGVKNIEDIKKGDFVISGKGKIRKVVRTYKNKHKEGLVSISVFGSNQKILATVNHRFEVINYKKGSKEYKRRKIEAADLSLNHLLILLKLDKLFPNKFKKSRKHPRYIFETDDYFAVPIKEIEVVDYEGDVHNLEVEKDHSYLVNGIAVKNCTYGEYCRQIEELAMNHIGEEDPMCVDFP